MKISPLDPALMQAWNKGRLSAEKEFTEKFATYLSEKISTLPTIPGIGEKTAWKIHEHFLEGMEDVESTPNRN